MFQIYKLKIIKLFSFYTLNLIAILTFIVYENNLDIG